ncbi:MAG: alpha-D-glucose phosphate-specific phosphoglucomutase [Siculibacillus sp.]|nr:alpha-D-glucose phosphate-specific phosphoglucomutase [Siculibacillus sp.]
MAARIVPTAPIDGQKPGTSGLRKKTRVFMTPGYLENYVQAIIEGVGGVKNREIVVGGDGRFFNDLAIGTILRMCAANGAKKAIVGRHGFLSTPAASNLIRERGAFGGFVLSASHNPGGPDEDFGLKFNVSNGGPAPEPVTDAIFAATKTIAAYRIVDEAAPPIDALGTFDLAGMAVEIVDPVADYVEMMRELVDFDRIRALFASGFTLRFDAMSAITGPYATAILEGELGAPMGTVINGTPLPDFGHHHPDPNPVHAKELFDLMFGPDAPDMGAASDGDGDRNIVLGRGISVAPSDSLALLAANLHLAKGYTAGVKGIARSMPTSRAADRVAERLGVDLYETPTGWKFFGNLLDAGRVTICGEESAGTGSDHVREKDGLWAVLIWLDIIAARKQSIAEIVHDHWKTHGRDYYSRHDYEGLPTDVADALFADLRASLPSLPGKVSVGLVIESADDFAYTDPTDGSVSTKQGVRIAFDNGGRAIFRLSGTGTEGATLRLYVEIYEPDPERQDLDPQMVLAGVLEAANSLAGIERRTGRDRPNVIT